MLRTVVLGPFVGGLFAAIGTFTMFTLMRSLRLGDYLSDRVL